MTSLLGWRDQFVAALFFLFCYSGALSANTDCVPSGKALISASGQVVSHLALVGQLEQRPVVLLGEHHDNAAHHRWQLQMISGLHLSNPKLALGFEMFPRRVQGILDQWVAGELSEKAFLKAVEWARYWNFDAQLYMPLFHYARMNKVPMYALNVERELIRLVGEKGWVNLSKEQRQGIGDPAPPSQGYQQMLASVFSQHGHKHEGGEVAAVDEAALARIIETPMFSRFVESQQVWDRAMAEVIADVSKTTQPDMFIAVMGSGHMMNYYGVPEQLAALEIEKPAVLVPWDPEFECEYLSPEFADAVIGLQADKTLAQRDKETKPRLGVYLAPAEMGVKIVRMVDASVAELAGLQKDDLIVQMAGVSITEVQQVIDVVKAMQWGTWLPMVVMRGEKEISVVAKFLPQVLDE